MKGIRKFFKQLETTGVNPKMLHRAEQYEAIQKLYDAGYVGVYTNDTSQRVMFNSSLSVKQIADAKRLVK